MSARRGIVLLEVLLAAAILAAVALALTTLTDRCVVRDAGADRLQAVARAAEDLLAQVQMRGELRTGVERGPVEGLPGATFSREVASEPATAPGIRVYRLTLEVSYTAAGRRRTFSLERWVVRAHGRQVDA